MAGHLLQLKTQSIKGSVRHDAPERATAIIAIAVTCLLAVLALLVIGAMWERDADMRGAVAVVAGTMVAIGSFLVSASAAEPAIDPRALIMSGRKPVVAAWESLLSSFIGVAPLCLAIVLAGYVALWRDEPASLGLGLAGAVVTWMLMVTLARLGSLTGRLTSDRGIASDVLSATMLVAVLAASPVLFVLVTAPWESGAGTVIRLVAAGLAWSPFGAALAAPATLVTAGTVPAIVQLGIGVATLAIAVAVWLWLGTRLAQGALGRRPASAKLDLGLIGALGRTPAGAVAARTVTYWLRDPRYRVVLTVVVLVPLLALVPLALAGVPETVLVLLPVPLLGFFFGWALHNDLAFDSTALWLHITAPMDGRSDRLGRALPTLWAGSVFVALGSAVTGLITGEWFVAISVLGVSLCLLLSATGISSITSVIFPYAVARPGDSPFSQPVSSWGAAAWTHPVTGLLAFVAAAPAITAGIFGLVTETWWLHLVALGAGVVVGACVLAWGIVAGGRRYETASSDLMTFATSA
ncbi:hypothetical protein GCM10011490_07040 [Pseudoclavibacter endophyticus]|uniref:Uncharacterized protein n=1 Tax=Pseudoclavibacter endophyticus TaxID=1778590 RepID=A0A6H9WUF1_9MICO|nr:hypothetical protein [Pseudoclavibacter endophyticus]KAB1649810.1 hypothetical protein F8O04_06155 [Pseudoclavibacter endophyticus]GGA59568.1 hypothetical protein GCM10011490_07040 [Pseudoclavibacter endophyticus]